MLMGSITTAATRALTKFSSQVFQGRSTKGTLYLFAMRAVFPGAICVQRQRMILKYKSPLLGNGHLAFSISGSKIPQRGHIAGTPDDHGGYHWPVQKPPCRFQSDDVQAARPVQTGSKHDKPWPDRYPPLSQQFLVDIFCREVANCAVLKQI